MSRGADPLIERCRTAVEQAAQRALRAGQERESASKAATRAESERLMEAVNRLARAEMVPAAHIYRKAVREFIERNVPPAAEPGGAE